LIESAPVSCSRTAATNDFTFEDARQHRDLSALYPLAIFPDVLLQQWTAG
jgi:hypothetical protein